MTMKGFKIILCFIVIIVVIIFGTIALKFLTWTQNYLLIFLFLLLVLVIYNIISNNL